MCCMFDLNNDREIGEGESVDLSVHVISQDANVYGKDVKATIRVNGGDGELHAWEGEVYRFEGKLPLRPLELISDVKANIRVNGARNGELHGRVAFPFLSRAHAQQRGYVIALGVWYKPCTNHFFVKMFRGPLGGGGGRVEGL